MSEYNLREVSVKYMEDALIDGRDMRIVGKPIYTPNGTYTFLLQEGDEELFAILTPNQVKHLIEVNDFQKSVKTSPSKDLVDKVMDNLPELNDEDSLN